MKTATTLISTDAKAFRAWFATQTVSKIIVAVGFAGVFAGVALALYLGSKFFFYTLAPSGEFGVITANYIIRAAVVMIFCLGVGSSTATTTSWFFSPDKSFFYLLTLPIAPRDIAAWITAKVVIINTVFLGVFLLPLELARGNSLVQAGLVLAGLAVTTTSVGGIAGLMVVQKFGKPNLLTTSGSILLFLAVLVGMVKLIFPPSMTELTTATESRFYQIYNGLPLASAWFPSNWPVIVLVGVCLACGYGYLSLLSSNFGPLLQKISSLPYEQEAVKQVPAKSRLAITGITSKDLASIMRSPAEAGYGLFLLLLMGLFFVLFSKANIVNTSQVWINNLTVFFYAGFVFFANTYLLRLVFPLMAKEGEAAWYIFTLPVAREKIVQAKLVTAGIVGLPLGLLALIVWWLPSFVAPNQWVLMVSSLWMIGVLIVANNYLGAIAPNFAQGTSPERVSTSSVGILALIVTSVLALVSAYSLFLFLSSKLSFINLFAYQITAGIAVVAVLYMVAKKLMNRYQF